MTRRRLIRSLAAALAATALLAPSAVARPDYPVGPAPGPTVVVEADESTGVDWGSAGIGAGAAVVIALVAGAAASTTVHHRRAAAR